MGKISVSGATWHPTNRSFGGAESKNLIAFVGNEDFIEYYPHVVLGIHQGKPALMLCLSRVESYSSFIINHHRFLDYFLSDWKELLKKYSEWVEENG